MLRVFLCCGGASASPPTPFVLARSLASCLIARELESTQDDLSQQAAVPVPIHTSVRFDPRSSPYLTLLRMYTLAR
ncbi:hypothetical protein BD310DRAFT_931780 [Dichomitus squalens]|uniref:Uncharacterized protein n=1 Tax=Dichomitus squalens TaxID=114155 RepID=A0A4Q9PPS2_9APHY|nr:hypothetical protein BD310DRAFT_931780 [Dichomitus squalens]